MATEIKVEALLLGTDPHSLLKSHTDALELELDGIVGDKHRGFAKPADGRDRGVARGTPVRNWRQWTAVSVEELRMVAERLAVLGIDPSLLGANILFSGIERLTQIPRGATIWFPDGAVLAVEGENAPCIGPGRQIAEQFPRVKPEDFPKAASHLRGLVGVVYKAGRIKVGDLAIIQNGSLT
jgi:MOSC domain-containing protein YiiM